MTRLAIIGFGKIARDQHAPSIAANSNFELVATARGEPAGDLPHYPDAAALLRAQAGNIDAVVIATPPGPRFAIACDCLDAGLDVLLEKPPASTLGELAALRNLADATGRTLFAAWHSQFAPAVARAAEALRGETVTGLRVVWHEDVRVWHPGQDWVFAAGGYGVFDPGINALSILSAILPRPLLVRSCALTIPEGRQSPIAAALTFADDGEADFDWRKTGEPELTIEVTTAGGRHIALLGGGVQLTIDGEAQALADEGEYPAIYRRFAELIRARDSQIDGDPLRVVAEAFLVASRETSAPFAWEA